MPELNPTPPSSAANIRWLRPTETPRGRRSPAVVRGSSGWSSSGGREIAAGSAPCSRRRAVRPRRPPAGISDSRTAERTAYPVVGRQFRALVPGPGPRRPARAGTVPRAGPSSGARNAFSSPVDSPMSSRRGRIDADQHLVGDVRRRLVADRTGLVRVRVPCGSPRAAPGGPGLGARSPDRAVAPVVPEQHVGRQQDRGLSGHRTVAASAPARPIRCGSWRLTGQTTFGGSCCS